MSSKLSPERPVAPAGATGLTLFRITGFDGDWDGPALAMVGDKLVVGASRADPGGLVDAGQVKVFALVPGGSGPPQEAVPMGEDGMPMVNPLEVTGGIVTAGSSTVFPLSEAMAERFIDEGYGGNITIASPNRIWIEQSRITAEALNNGGSIDITAHEFRVICFQHPDRSTAISCNGKGRDASE